jgi:hypothetical protein
MSRQPDLDLFYVHPIQPGKRPVDLMRKTCDPVSSRLLKKAHPIGRWLRGTV